MINREIETGATECSLVVPEDPRGVVIIVDADWNYSGLRRARVVEGWLQLHHDEGRRRADERARRAAAAGWRRVHHGRSAEGWVRVLNWFSSYIAAKS